MSYDCGDDSKPVRKGFEKKIKRKCIAKRNCNFKAAKRNVPAVDCPSKYIRQDVYTQCNKDFSIFRQFLSKLEL